MTHQALANAWAWLIQASLKAKRDGLDAEMIEAIQRQAAQVKVLHDRVSSPIKETA